MKQNKIKQHSLVPILAGTAMSLIVGVIGIMGLSVLMLNERVGESSATISVAIVLFAASILGGLFTRILDRNQPKYLPLAVGAIYICVLLVIGLALFEGSLQHMWLNAAVVAAGAVISCYIGFRNRGNTHSRRRRSR